MSDPIEINTPDAKHIKLRIPGESFWALLVEGQANQATVDNVLLSGDYSYGDLVEYDPDSHEVLRLVERRFVAARIDYDSTDGKETDRDVIDNEVCKDNYVQLYEHFEPHGISVEGMMAGSAMVAIPVDMPARQLRAIVDTCPFKRFVLIMRPGGEG